MSPGHWDSNHFSNRPESVAYGRSRRKALGPGGSLVQTQAYAEFLSVVGPEGVITDPAKRSAAETATFQTEQTIPLIVCPSTRDQVRDCLLVAAKCAIAVYPISGGKNWGYGSKV